MLVYYTLNIRQQVRCIMHFVQNHSFSMLVQENYRVILSITPHIKILQ